MAMGEAARRMAGGSRFLFEPFEYDAAPEREARVRQAQEVREVQAKLLDMRFSALDGRLERLEVVMERMERRLWLTVYGVVATVLAQAFKALMTMAPQGGF
jgi:hypothetical protein